MPRLTCPSCSARLRVAAQVIGRPVRCPRCQRRIGTGAPRTEAGPVTGWAEDRDPAAMTEDEAVAILIEASSEDRIPIEFADLEPEQPTFMASGPTQVTETRQRPASDNAKDDSRHTNWLKNIAGLLIIQILILIYLAFKFRG